ncbi:MAG TPA: hypothetical protein PKE59_00400 [Novosphingobium sp.]|jgi:hypothetical protein|nr:hypothetical protein [Novosphingobium sp.]
MRGFELAEGWRVEIDGDRCRFYLGAMLMGSAAALRALADMCDVVLPPAPPPQPDLFGDLE